MIEILLAGGAAYGGYRFTKKMVVRKLRFVPKARRGVAPWLAGAGAIIVAAPIAAVFPFITGLTAAALGAGVTGGVFAGDREVQRTNVWGEPR